MRAKRIFEGNRWRIKLKLGEVFKSTENNDMDNPDDFDQFKSLIMPKLRRFKDKMNTFIEDDDSLLVLEDLVFSLGEADDSDEWDFIWEDFYDWADDNSVWIDVNSFDEDDEDIDNENNVENYYS